MPKGLQTAEATGAATIDISASSNTAVEIDLSVIAPSPFEPQARRRAKFDRDELLELGKSIKLHGLAQPIVVRARNGAPGKPLEIVFGERRWLASRIAGLGKILCFVRDYDDAQVIELQYEENHRRQKNDPLDDAYYFKYLKEKEGYSDDDLADRLNTTIQNVRDKLKLGDLIEEAREELSDGRLPLKHAVHLAKFPVETQKEIVCEQYAYRHYDRDEKHVSFETFLVEVEENILRRLLGAPFDVADPRLHVRGLLCRDCPDNSAHATHLFPELAPSPRCLNKTCFQVKTNTHLRLQRDDIAASRPNPALLPVSDLAAEVPLVTERKYQSERTPFGKEKVLTGQELLDEPECAFSESAVAVEGARKGQKVYVCRNNDCPVHHPKPAPGELSEDELNDIDIDFDRRVANLVRLKILKTAMNWFDDYKTFWTFDDLVKELIVENLFERADLHADVLYLVRDWNGAPKNFADRNRVSDFVSGLDKRGQSQLLFVLSAISKSSEDLGVLTIAASYPNVNFFLLDAETRLELAPPEFKEQAKEYLEAVKTGNVCDVPRFWRRSTGDVAMVSGEEN